MAALVSEAAADSDSVVVVVARRQIDQERRNLGRLLGERRRAAGLSQLMLTGRIAYSRSTIANAENGSRRAALEFWQSCDRELAAGGDLLAAYGLVQALSVALEEQRKQAGRRARQERARGMPGDSFPLVPVGGTVGHLPDVEEHRGLGVVGRREAPMVNGCGFPLTVVRWSGWETRALREAMRLTVRQFAARVRVRPTSVAGWETLAANGLLPATQKLLDDLLTSMDVDGRTRMRALLRGHPFVASQYTRGQVIDRHECAASGPVGPVTARVEARSGRARRGGPVLVHDGARAVDGSAAASGGAEGWPPTGDVGRADGRGRYVSRP